MDGLARLIDRLVAGQHQLPRPLEPDALRDELRLVGGGRKHTQLIAAVLPVRQAGEPGLPVRGPLEVELEPGVITLNVLEPADDLAPVTVVTHVRRAADGSLVARGTTSDNGTVKRVLVNGIEAKPTRENFAEWEAVVPLSAKVSAYSEDAAGNVERLAHEVVVR